MPSAVSVLLVGTPMAVRSVGEENKNYTDDNGNKRLYRFCAKGLYRFCGIGLMLIAINDVAVSGL